MTRLRKALCDVYGRSEIDGKYQPFVADKIKEHEPDAQIVPLCSHLPPRVVDVVSSPSHMLRPLALDEEEELTVLKVRYNHFGGEFSEWVKYHHLPSTWPLWQYEDDADHFYPAAIMAVGRAKDDLQRKITATCPFNFACHRPEALFPELVEDLGMLGAASLSTVFTSLGIMHFALFDESQVFIAVLILDWMWSW